MKKLLASLLVMSMILVGCSGGNSGSKGAEIALITDAGNINDKSFNQSAHEAIEQFIKDNENLKSDTNKLTYKYYRPQVFDTAGYNEQIDLAVENGAKVIVTPGYKFGEAVAQKQTEYPDVKFIFIDAVPEGDTIGSNVYCALYAEEEAGYLAGYAAVKDGYTKLGFMGGNALPAVIRFGYGYIQGADAAAKELGVNVEVKYNYTNSFEAKPEITTLAAAWYEEGTEVIFSCGGGICTSIFEAASKAGKMTIGVDSDQKDDSDTVLTSAVKGVRKTVTDQLAAFYAGTFEGGKVETLTIKEDYVGISEDYSRFKTYTKEENDVIVQKLKSGEVTIKNDTAVSSASELSTENVTVVEVK